MPMYFNTKNGPVYLEDGRSFGAYENIELSAEEAASLVEGGYLVEYTVADESSNDSSNGSAKGSKRNRATAPNKSAETVKADQPDDTKD